MGLLFLRGLFDAVNNEMTFLHIMFYSDNVNETYDFMLEANMTNWVSPQQIASNYKRDKNRLWYPSDQAVRILLRRHNVKSGDVYAFRFYYPYNTAWRCVIENEEELRQIQRELDILDRESTRGKMAAIEARNKELENQKDQVSVSTKATKNGCLHFTDLPDESIELLKNDDVFYGSDDL